MRRVYDYKVEPDLRNSDWSYEFDGFVFYFSSPVLRDKFEEKIEPFVSEAIAKIYKTLARSVEGELVFALKLYETTEKRGFRVYNKIEDKFITPNYNVKLEIDYGD